MEFWWVNHKQTVKEETEGGYIWSPKKNKNNSRNQSYVNMTLVQVGDIIFSYANLKIASIGVVSKSCQSSDRPSEFKSNDTWNIDGYMVRINWMTLENSIKPKNYLQLIVSLLPKKYAPIQKNGNGNQVCYLANINNELGGVLLDIISDNNSIDNIIQKNIDSEESQIQDTNTIKEDTTLTNTEKQRLINSRIGQGKFKEKLCEIEKYCRITKLTNSKLLIASHIKPWKVSNNYERLDGNNGLLLSPHIDKLFDRGYISFNNNGTIKYIKNFEDVLDIWNIDFKKNYGKFNNIQKTYLKYHRENIFNKNV